MASFLLLPANVLADDPMMDANHGPYSDEEIYYQLDLVDDGEWKEDDKAWWDLSRIVDGFEDGMLSMLYYVFQMGLDLAFSFNILMTNVMLSILELAYEIDIINALIDKVSATIVGITGISGGSVSTGVGLFGGFLGLISLIVALYTLYQFIVKRATLEAFSGLLKSIIAVSIALLFFSQYSTIIKGANSISTELSAFILSGDVSDLMDASQNANGDINTQSALEKMNDNLFTTFVHNPYLLMQYGTTDEDSIGQGRVQALLQAQPNSDQRQELVLEEIKQEENYMMTYGKIMQRYNYAGVMVLGNAVSSIPVYLLSLSLILFQFWFLIMALVAPFALLWSALPGQFGVLKRYGFELFLPLVLKACISLGALLIFGLSEVVLNLTSITQGSTKGYILAIVLQTMLFISLFLLRKRIGGIFTKGSEQLAAVREQLNSAFVNPVKKGVQTGTAITGAAIAGAATGFNPAMMLQGANIGKTAGQIMTDDESLNNGMDSIARQGLQAAFVHERLENRPPKLTKVGKKAVQQFASMHDLTAFEQKQLQNALQNQGVTDVTEEELVQARESYTTAMALGEIDSDTTMANYVASTISSDRTAEKAVTLRTQGNMHERLDSQAQRFDQIKSTQFLKKRVSPAEYSQVEQMLSDRGMDIPSSEEMKKHYQQYKTLPYSQKSQTDFPTYLQKQIDVQTANKEIDVVVQENMEYLQQVGFSQLDAHALTRQVEKGAVQEGYGSVKVHVTKEQIVKMVEGQGQGSYQHYLSQYEKSATTQSAPPLNMKEFITKEINEKLYTDMGTFKNPTELVVPESLPDGTVQRLNP